MSSIKFLSINKWLRNLYSSFKYDFHKDVLSLRQQLQQKDIELMNLKNLHLLSYIRLYYNENQTEAGAYEVELKHIRENLSFSTYPYYHVKPLEQTLGGYDVQKKMPFVLHHGKRLYFPSDMSEQLAIETYRYYVECECLLGGGYVEKAPHQYQTDNFKIEEGDVLLDVGCADALVALDAIEKVSKVYLFESDPKWISALNATFAPYKAKVVFINKLVSDRDTETSITLETALAQETGKSLFVKMDIEGYEVSVIKASEKFLTSNRYIKLACCTYHRATDAEVLNGLFEKLNYQTEFSDGYMLFSQDEHQQPPYFRHGVIRAKNF